MKRFNIAILLLLSASALISCEKDSGSNPNETHTYTLSQKRSEKRGGAQSFQLPDMDIPLLGSSTAWSYNWSNSSPSSALDALFQQYGMLWCPMVWNDNYNADAIRNYARTHSGTQYLLGFNEPNLTDQCNMTPAQAAEHWPAVVALAKETGMKLVSPAMNYGTLEGYHDPIKWLDEFFAIPGINLSDIDAIAVHCYMPSASSVKNFIEMFRKYGKPVWLTEFCNGNSNRISAEDQLKYLCETLNMLEQNDLVERYAWFQPRSGFNGGWNNNLLTSTQPIELTTLGKVFVNLSTFDQSIVYGRGDVIPAEQYCFAEGPFHLAPSTDGGILDLTDFRQGCETRYHIDLPKAGTYTFKLRYQTYMETDLSFGTEGALDTYEMKNTGHEWTTEAFQLDLPAGRSDLILRAGSAAGIMINWMIIQ